MILRWLKRCWEVLNMISPETRSIIIILLFGWVMYSLINQSTLNILNERFQKNFHMEKQAEQYTKNTAVEINKHVRLIAHKDHEAFDVLLLSYHNSKQSLLGYKYLYLSCLTEAPKSIDVPLLKALWSNLDYVYYADELERLHNLSVVKITDITKASYSLPKLCRLIKISEANSAIFFVVEGKSQPIGMVVILYKDIPNPNIDYLKIVLPTIQKLAILLDYENVNGI